LAAGAIVTNVWVGPAVAEDTVATTTAAPTLAVTAAPTLSATFTTTGAPTTVVATAAPTEDAGLVVDNKSVDVYFGVGCFWHIQHEFVEAERTMLGRTDKTLTSLTGYAGGTATGKDGLVCYHNFQSIGDYGRLGHGEVVGMTLPSNKVKDFAAVYFSLFDPKTKGAF